MLNDGRSTYGSQTYKDEYEAKQAILTAMLAGNIEVGNKARVEYVGGSKPYIITLIKFNN